MDLALNNQQWLICHKTLSTNKPEKEQDWNNTRILCAGLNNSWKQHPTKQQVYSQLLPISQTLQVKRAKHARHGWRNKDKLIKDAFLRTPTYGHSSFGRSAKTYIHQNCADTGCCQEDLLRTITERYRGWERIKGISAVSTPWMRLVGRLVLWHINLCRLFNAKSIFMQIISSISNN